MKYDEKYPNAEAWDEPEPCILKEDLAEPCFECGVSTSWIELNFQVAICSEECFNKVLEEYNRS